jgi:hypothetical protein
MESSLGRVWEPKLRLGHPVWGHALSVEPPVGLPVRPDFPVLHGRVGLPMVKQVGKTMRWSCSRGVSRPDIKKVAGKSGHS